MIDFPLRSPKRYSKINASSTTLNHTCKDDYDTKLEQLPLFSPQIWPLDL